jgi:hypothetical protein
MLTTSTNYESNRFLITRSRNFFEFLDKWQPQYVETTPYTVVGENPVQIIFSIEDYKSKNLKFYTNGMSMIRKREYLEGSI